MSCCEQNARGAHCDCRPCGMCLSIDAERRIAQDRKLSMTWFANGFGIATLLAAIAWLLATHGCSCELQTHPTSHAGITIVGEPRDTSTRNAPHVGHGWWDEDGGD